MPGSRGQAPVTSDERSRQRLSQSDIDSIISRHVVPEFPYAGQECIVWISVDGEVDEVFQRLLPPLRLHLPEAAIAPQDLSNLKIKEVGRVKGFKRRKNALFNL